MDVIFREFEIDKDLQAVIRIWKEVGWLGRDDEEGFPAFLEGSRGWVAELEGAAECFVLMTPGEIRYLHEALRFVAVTGVTTSRIVRRMGLARRLLARALAGYARDGYDVAGLGMFEQGFYDALGFGTGGYEHRVAFDPAKLRVAMRPRVPCRLSTEDWEEIHRLRLTRRKGHGACDLLPPGITRAGLAEGRHAFGLGYRDEDDHLTHMVWLTPENVEVGPYHAELLYQSREQFLELLALVRSLGDQVHLVTIREPADIQLQDLMEEPMRSRHVTEQSKFAVKITALAYWQARMLDLERCLERTHLDGESVCFNLRLTDPVAKFQNETGWPGIGGNYIVVLGEECNVRDGQDERLPVLEASVGAFSRMWLGVRRPSGLAVTDDFRAPQDLLDRLDVLMRLPQPQPDWEF